MTLLMCISSPTSSAIPLGKTSFHLPSSTFPWRAPDSCFQQALPFLAQIKPSLLRTSWAAPTRLPPAHNLGSFQWVSHLYHWLIAFRGTHQKMIDWNTSTATRQMRLLVMAPRYLSRPWPVRNKKSLKNKFKDEGRVEWQVWVSF